MKRFLPILLVVMCFFWSCSSTGTFERKDVSVSGHSNSSHTDFSSGHWEGTFSLEGIDPDIISFIAGGCWEGKSVNERKGWRLARLQLVSIKGWEFSAIYWLEPISRGLETAPCPGENEVRGVFGKTSEGIEMEVEFPCFSKGRTLYYLIFKRVRDSLIGKPRGGDGDPVTVILHKKGG